MEDERLCLKEYCDSESPAVLKDSTGVFLLEGTWWYVRVTAGIPDIIACVNGRFIAFEVKTPSGKATKLQEATIRKILNAGGVAAVVHSVDEVKAILEKHGLL